MEDWFASPLGQTLLGEQKAFSERCYKEMYGPHFGFLGAKAGLSLLEHNCSVHRFAFNLKNEHTPGTLVTHPDKIALLSDSVQGMLLYHLFEEVSAPYEIMREIARIVAPGGHILLFGFNAMSLFGMRKLLFPIDYPWNTKFYSSIRIQDWLSVSGFEILRLETFLLGIPSTHHLINSHVFCKKFLQPIFPNIGASYGILAVKRVAPLTRVRPKASKLRMKLKPIIAEQPSSSLRPYEEN